MESVEDLVKQFCAINQCALDLESFRRGVISYWENMNNEELLQRFNGEGI